MNKKLIAIAVAGTFVAPTVAMAEATWYGRINTAVSYLNQDNADNSTDVKNISSRFGVKGSEDLGNGLSAVYRYEFGVASDVADVQDNNRLSYVGLSGNFGTVTLGRVWSAAFNSVGTIMDPSQNVGGDAYNGPYRTSNTVSYATNAGPVALQADIMLDGDNANTSGIDAWEVGGTFSTGGLSIAATYVNTDGGDADDTDFTGVAAKYNMESFWVGAGYTTTDDGSDDDTTGVALLAGGGGGDFSWWASLENVQDDDTDTDTDIINLNLTRHLSKTFRVYIEAAMNNESGDGADSNEILFGVRSDF
jgi:predicted porin